MRKQGQHARRSRPSRRLRSRLISLGIVATAVVLSGCGKTVEGTIAQVCGPNNWREIGVRKADKITDDTAREIIGNNEARRAWCSGKKA